MIAIGAVAHGIQGAGTKVRKVQSSPTLGDAMIVGTIVKQSVLGVAGATSQDTAVFGALIVSPSRPARHARCWRERTAASARSGAYSAR
jgi:hypothetical protein